MKWTFALQGIARLVVQLSAMNATIFERDFSSNERTYLILSMCWLEKWSVSSSKREKTKVWPRTRSSLWRMNMLRILRKNVSLHQNSHQTSVRRYPSGTQRFSSLRLWRQLLCICWVYQCAAACSSYVWWPAHPGKLQRYVRCEQCTPSNRSPSPRWIPKETTCADSRFWSN